MTRNIIKLPLVGKEAVAAASLPRADSPEDGGSIMHYVCFVAPNILWGLDQIPKGPNPRYYNGNSKVPKAIEASFLEDENFAIKNRGMQVIVDDGSVKVIEEDGDHYIQFECSEPGMTGHYDGQHTEEKVTGVISVLGDEGHNQHLPLALVERSAFRTLQEARDAARAVNNVQKQKSISEFDIAGGFDQLKNSLSYCHVDNVGWAQNQIATSTQLVTKECSATQVTCLIGALLPKTYKKKVAVSDICCWPKKGETVIDKYNESVIGELMHEAAAHIDTLLALSDYIQSTTREVIGNSFENYEILKMHSAAQLKKSVTQRKAYKATLFNGASQIEYGLNKDLMPVLCYAIVNGVYEYSEKDGFTTIFTIEEMKAIWREAGGRVLSSVEGRFKNSFQANYKSRWGDFVLDIQMWSQAADIVSHVIHNPTSWKRHLTTTVNQQAAAK